MDIVLIKRADLEAAIRDAAIRGADLALRRAPKNRPAQYRKIDAAKELGISRPTLDRMISAGNIRLNECGRVPASEIDRVIAGREAA